jgi:hypothetical protein
VLIVVKNYLTQILNMKVVLGGLLFMSLCLMYLKQKQIIYWAMQEQSTIAKNVAVITDIYLMTGPTQLAKDSAIMVFV